MARARIGNTIIAESEAFELVEGNVYFPRGSVRFEHLEPSEHQTECGWKGTAHYHHVVVDDVRLDDAAWHYPSPKPAAENIRDHIAFWRGVIVER